jgi:arylsulfatase
MATSMKYLPRKVQSYGYNWGDYVFGLRAFQLVRDQQQKEGVHIALPTGN